MLHTVDATVTGELVEELLTKVAAAPAARSQLTKHLVAHPGVLTAGGSRMPKVVGEFLYAAIAAGVTGLVSPSCALCSQPRTLFHTHGDGERICLSCYSRERTATCSRCGREHPHRRGRLRRVRHHRHGRRGGSRNLCLRCYRHPTKPCGICGRLNGSRSAPPTRHRMSARPATRRR